ncbi:MAG: hypothetical protein ACD_75C00867G0001 [uncultured bacterium]|nr:MAG: hypothetical protein ACD_75C00867G0001 [uncultured bacterium]
MIRMSRLRKTAREARTSSSDEVTTMAQKVFPTLIGM